jgi:16S rRNA processing protein RimM
MINLDHCILLGTLAKTHGVKGQMILRLKCLSFENIKRMEAVFIVIDDLPVPFFISEYQPKNADEIILTFDDIDTVRKAQSFLGCPAWLDTDSVSNSESRLSHDPANLIGFLVIDIVTGKLGTLSEILELDQNPLLKIDGQKKNILIPLQPDFIYKIDPAVKTIYVKTPEGLYDI